MSSGSSGNRIQARFAALLGDTGEERHKKLQQTRIQAVEMGSIGAKSNRQEVSFFCRAASPSLGPYEGRPSRGRADHEKQKHVDLNGFLTAPRDLPTRKQSSKWAGL